jgi:hypothetical protein
VKAAKDSWAHLGFFELSLAMGWAGSAQARRHGVYGIPLFTAVFWCGNVQKVQVAPMFAAASVRDGS